MSRDFTPRELYMVDRDSMQKGRGSFLDQRIVFRTPEGEEIFLMKDDEINFRKKYPVLGVCFDPLWTWYMAKPDEIRRSVINSAEIALNFYIKASTIDDNFKSVAAWFEGQLDPAFYYNERNNELLVEFLDECYRKRSKVAELVYAIQADPYISKIKFPYKSVSGSSTDVYPITVWERTVNIKLFPKFDKEMAEKCVESFVLKHNDVISTGRLCMNDASCSPEIELVLTDKYTNR